MFGSLLSCLHLSFLIPDQNKENKQPEQYEKHYLSVCSYRLKRRNHSLREEDVSQAAVTYSVVIDGAPVTVKAIKNRVKVIFTETKCHVFTKCPTLQFTWKYNLSLPAEESQRAH